MGWAWLCMIGVAGMVTNILSFEGVELARLSGTPLKDRFRSLFVLRAA